MDDKNDVSFLGENVLCFESFDEWMLDTLFSYAKELKVKLSKGERIPLREGRVLGLAYFEENKTSMNCFHEAMKKLGGETVILDCEKSSLKKGESFEDTVRMLESYTDALVIRHLEIDSALRATRVSRKPIINAGGGKGPDPIKALDDEFNGKYGGNQAENGLYIRMALLSLILGRVPPSLSPPVVVKDERFTGKSIVSVDMFDGVMLETLFGFAKVIKDTLLKGETFRVLENRKLGLGFFEASTRTMCSFDSAMKRLGGETVFLNGEECSLGRGEKFEEIVINLNSRCDASVIRHPQVGSAQRAKKVSNKPIINGGDGAGEHPSQSLLDIFTIREELGSVDGKVISLVGDLKNGRTVHSLVKLLSLYKVKLQFVSIPELGMPEAIKSKLNEKNIPFEEIDSLEKAIVNSDILYMTRIQAERFESREEYIRCRDNFILTPHLMHKAKAYMRVMHPLPRVNEISTEVDQDSRAAYFRQAENGVYTRMALLALVLY